jgi:hypothetical protein
MNQRAITFRDQQIKVILWRKKGGMNSGTLGCSCRWVCFDTLLPVSGSTWLLPAVHQSLCKQTFTKFHIYLRGYKNYRMVSDKKRLYVGVYPSGVQNNEERK